MRLSGAALVAALIILVNISSSLTGAASMKKRSVFNVQAPLTHLRYTAAYNALFAGSANGTVYQLNATATGLSVNHPIFLSQLPSGAGPIVDIFVDSTGNLLAVEDGGDSGYSWLYVFNPVTCTMLLRVNLTSLAPSGVVLRPRCVVSNVSNIVVGLSQNQVGSSVLSGYFVNLNSNGLLLGSLSDGNAPPVRASFDTVGGVVYFTLDAQRLLGRIFMETFTSNLDVQSLFIGTFVAMRLDSANRALFLSAVISSTASIVFKLKVPDLTVISLYFATGAVSTFSLDTTADYLHGALEDGSIIKVDSLSMVLKDQVQSGVLFPITLSDSAFVTTTKTLYASNSTGFIATFTMEDCASRSNCTGCNSFDRYCGWCLEDNICALNSTCSRPGLSTSMCPAASLIAPAVGNLVGSTAVTITGTNLAAALNPSSVRCVFTPGLPVVATSVVSNAIVCSSPPRAVTGPVTVTLTYQGNPYTSGAFTFTYYDCTVRPNCTSCVASFQSVATECSWCMANATCSALSLLVGQPCGSFGGGAASCPGLSIFTNGRAPIQGVTGNGVTIAMSNVGGQDFCASILNRFCVFNGTINVPATCSALSGSMKFTCDIPAVDAPKNLTFQVTTQGRPISPDVLVESYYDCTAPDCGSCNNQGDKPLCGWCAADNLCEPSASCVGGTTAPNWLQGANCPTMTLANPSRGSVAGGTSVTITGTQFVNSILLQCRFGNLVVNATWSSAGSVVCQSPAQASTGILPLYLQIRGANYTATSLMFEYYNCSTLTNCSSCTTGFAECGWCALQSKCTIVSACAVSDNYISGTGQCPALSGIAPASGPIYGLPNFLTISGKQFVNNSGLSCVFNGTNPIPARFINGTTLSCDLPTTSSATFVLVNVFVAGVPYSTDPPLNFVYYDCNQGCATCVDAVRRPLCGFCVSTGNCSLQATCTLQSSFQVVAGAQACPGLFSILPASGSTAGNTVIRVKGSLFDAALGLSCVFGSTPIAASVINSTDLTCSSPPGTLGSVTFFLQSSGGAAFGNQTQSFTYYDCSAFSTCQVCAGGANHAECGYCSAQSKCSVVNDCIEPATFLTSNLVSQCPSFTRVAPQSVGIYGGSTLYVYGGSFRSGLSCNFSGIIVPATFINATTMTCLSPVLSSATNLSVFIVNGNASFVNASFVMEFYDCGTMSSCATCTGSGRAQCGWCLSYQNCTISAVCPVSSYVQSCPTVTLSNPNKSSTSGMTVVTVTGSYFISTSSLQCVFGTTPVAATVDSTTSLHCTTPTQPAGATSLVIYDTNTAKNYSTSAPLSYSFYDCNATNRCDLCNNAAQPECGWCPTQHQCTVSTACAVSGAWSSSTCPRVQSIIPNTGAINGNTSVTIGGSAFFTGVTYFCLFGTVSTPATYFNATAVTCASPAGAVGSVLVRVLDAVSNYSTDAVTFTYYDCAQGVANCQQCLSAIRPECGFCMDAYNCTVSASCTVFTRVCPALSTLTPSSGAIDGNTTIAVAGVFFPSLMNRYVCVFNANGTITNMPAVYQSTTGLTCLSPPGAVNVSANVTIMDSAFPMTVYAPQLQRFSYYNCSAFYDGIQCTSCISAARGDCGFCYNSAGGSTCVVASQCNVIYPYSNKGCASLNSITPTTGSLDGGTLVTFNVTGVFAIPQTQIACEFGGVQTSPSSIINSNATGDGTFLSIINCSTPALAMPAGQYDVRILYTGNPYSQNVLRFNYYSCSVNCSQCTVGRSECNWCDTASNCTNVAKCAGFQAPGNCPLALNTNATSGSSSGGTIVTFTGLRFNTNSGTLSCSFGGVTSLVYGFSTTSVSCVAPAHVAGNYSLAIVNPYKNVMGDTTFTYEFYDCINVGGSCGACIGVRAECGWCGATSTCAAANNCTGSFSYNTCPVVSGLTPVNGSLSGGTVVSVQGSSTSVPLLALTCRFRIFTQTSNSIIVPATFSAGTGVFTCASPAMNVTGLYTVRVFNGNVQYGSVSLNYTYYDCNISQACETCIDSSRKECGWCALSGDCRNAATCGTGGWQNATTACPSMQAPNPTSGSILGGTLVTISGVTFLPFVGLQCVFGGTSVTANYLNTTAISCLSPSRGGAGSVSLRLNNVNASRTYTSNNLTFVYYDCSAPLTCGSCISSSQSECGWCSVNSGCSTSGQCNNAPLFNSVSSSSCTTYSQIAPNSGAMFGGTLVVITGQNFPNIATMKCQFGSIGVQNATFINSTAISCNSPPFSGSSLTVNITIRNNGVLLGPSTVFPYTYYNCSAPLNNCGGCRSAGAECGWCNGRSLCMVLPLCPVSTDWTRGNCPTLSGGFATPNNGSRTGGTNVTITIGDSVFVQSASLSCIFGSTSVPAQFISSSSVLCVSPPQAGSGAVPISVVNGALVYANGTLNFTYYDCNVPCGSCLQAGLECGVCAAQNPAICSTSVACLGGWARGLCPTVSSVSPASGSIVGGTNFTVNGTLFLNNGGPLLCTMNGVPLPTRFVNSNTVNCTTLQVGAVGVQNVSVTINGQPWDTTSTRTFTFYNCASATTCESCNDTVGTECGWCPITSTCSVQRACTAGWAKGSNSTCPRLGALSPATGAMDGGTAISVTGSGFANTGNLTCAFNSTTTPAVFVNTTLVTCTTPALFAATASTSALFRLLNGGIPFSSDLTVRFTFYSCNPPSGTPGCASQCSVIGSECGWCRTGGNCTVQSKCNVGASWSAVFGNNASCPAIIDITPNRGAYAGGTVITIRGVNFFNNPSLHCTFDGAGFTTTIVQPVFINASALTCTSPNIAPLTNPPTQWTVSLKTVSEQPYVPAGVIFTYYLCSALSSTCATCTNANFSECGWCSAGNTCSDRSTCLSAAPSSAFWGQGACPSVTSISPGSGHVNGNTTVVIRGSNFIGDPSIVCRFGPTRTVNATFVNANTITCSSPPQAAGTVTVSLIYAPVNTAFATGTLSFTYYTCGCSCSDSLHTCAQGCQGDGTQTECGFCGSKNLCLSKNECNSTTWQQLGCPSASLILPVTGAMEGGTPVTIIGSLFDKNLPLKCGFVAKAELTNYLVVDAVVTQTGIDPANPSFGQSLMCNTSQSPMGRDGVAVMRVLNGNQPYTTDILPFQYYDCGKQTCRDCVSAIFSECGWCQRRNLCTVTGNCTADAYDRVCPTFTQVNPPSGSIYGNTTVTVTGSVFNPLLPLQCRFGLSLVNATNITSTSFQCVSPSNMASGTVQVNVINNGGSYVTNSLGFNYYDCNVQKDCGSCYSPNRAECAWCATNNTCSIGNMCAGGRWLPSCPLLTQVTPPSGAIQGDTLVTIHGDYMYPDLPLVCRFDALRTVPVIRENITLVNVTETLNVTDPDTNETTEVLQFTLYNVTSNYTELVQEQVVFVRNASMVPTGDLLSCTTPAWSVDTLNLTVLNDGVTYGPTPPLNFTYYDCAVSNSSCSECVSPARSDCVWCMNTHKCTVSSLCSAISTFPACPTLNSITPSRAVVTGGTQVSITASVNFVESLTYQCRFIGTSTKLTAATVSGKVATCSTPIVSDEFLGLSTGFTTLAATPVLVDLIEGGLAYVAQPIAFAFYNCSSATTIDACHDDVTAPDCGWCFQEADSYCSSVDFCPAPGVFTESVPVLSGAVPSSAESSFATSVRLNGSFIAVDNLYCHWGFARGVTPASVSSGTTVECITPTTVQTGSSVTVTLVTGLPSGPWSPYGLGSTSFTFYDCSPTAGFSTCASCEDASTVCGYCAVTTHCSGALACAAASANSPWHGDCPGLDTVLPNTGSGGTVVTISGHNFYDPALTPGVSLSCRFDSLTSQATFVSSVALTCVVPANSGTAETVSVSVLLNGTEIASQGLFTYTATSAIIATPPSNAAQPEPLPWTYIGIGAGLALLLLLIVIALVVRRRSRGGAGKALKAPDFVPIAFQPSLFKLQYRSSSIQGLLALEEILQEPDMSFVFAVADATAITEADKVCQALVYSFEHSGKSVPLCNGFISREVAISQSDGTLFRQNSFASKLFKTYSKMIGLPYLFQTLAVNINEICRDHSGEGGNAVEIDANKMGEDENLGLNKFTLLLSCQKMLVSIFRSETHCPNELRLILRHVSEQVERKYPQGNTRWISIGAFIILRFITPAITAPEAYGLVNVKDISTDARRHLVLIAKVLQNLANGVRFGKKEAFMLRMNDFIDENLPAIQDFFDRLARVELTAPLATLPAGGTIHTRLPRNVRENSLYQIHAHIILYIKKINLEINNLPAAQCRALLIWLAAVLNEVGAVTRTIEDDGPGRRGPSSSSAN